MRNAHMKLIAQQNVVAAQFNLLRVTNMVTKNLAMFARERTLITRPSDGTLIMRPSDTDSTTHLTPLMEVLSLLGCVSECVDDNDAEEVLCTLATIEEHIDASFSDDDTMLLWKMLEPIERAARHLSKLNASEA